MLTTVYVGLGSNLGDSKALLAQALQSISALPEVHDLASSRFYITTPVSAIAQNDYLNAVCRFTTSFSAKELLSRLQQIEIALGKTAAIEKNSPRYIDLDILLFGLETHHEKALEIPHPRWSQRLFVLIPLLDLATELQIPDPKSPSQVQYMNLHNYLQTFKNINHETVSLLNQEVCDV
jgi:2-amino-4-hydroxy-6-hydroxymethyldihydropteridine diphosphokinase